MSDKRVNIETVTFVGVLRQLCPSKLAQSISVLNWTKHLHSRNIWNANKTKTRNNIVVTKLSKTILGCQVNIHYKQHYSARLLRPCNILTKTEHIIL